MTEEQPVVVSAIIPTRNRPDLVTRAVQSALRQDYPHLEVIVVIDGPDSRTLESLKSVRDSRIRILPLSETKGGAEARNIGARAAIGEWVAFLDDDDEWLPSKIASQLECGLSSSVKFPVVSSRLLARSPSREYVWPRRLPRSGEPISEYLFARRSLFQGEGLVTTTTLFTKRELLLKVPFGSDQPRHQDWDWLLRALAMPDTQLLFVAKPLSIWYIEESRATVSGETNWRYSYDWIERVRPLITPRAYAAFLLTLVAATAERGGKPADYLRILTQAIRRGRPAVIDLLLFMGMVTIPQNHRRQLRALFSR
jgi:glycosyltransferase involved in cell wall biosynthesis